MVELHYVIPAVYVSIMHPVNSAANITMVMVSNVVGSRHAECCGIFVVMIIALVVIIVCLIVIAILLVLLCCRDCR